MNGGRARTKNGPALAGHGAEAVRDAIAAAITTLREQLRRSLTWDQGSEMSQHPQLRIDTGLKVYFCDPHSRWQRGTNENTNDLLRQYFPEGTDFTRHIRRGPRCRRRDAQQPSSEDTLLEDTSRGTGQVSAIMSTRQRCDGRLIPPNRSAWRSASRPGGGDRDLDGLQRRRL
jgi:hypothetical protein